MTGFYVADIYGMDYICYGTNFHMAGANPTIQLLLYSLEEKCWLVDDAAKYTPAKAIEEYNSMMASPAPSTEAFTLSPEEE